ncbi:DUF4097 family beta strand repeat-containing protein [Enterococcus hailinensis]|uniref:DUF4097 family beta strand repeat-containing protein n=1 Tax=Enterococcus hailinensis TaxID=3238988 RepID=UPI0038B35A3D
MKKIIVGVILVGAALVSISSLFFHNQVMQKEYTTKNKIDTLIVDDRNTPIKVVGTAEKQTRIQYAKTRNTKYKIQQKGQELKFVRNRSNWWSPSFFSFGKDQAQVTIEVPQEQLKDLQVETSNAQVSVEKIALATLEIETSNSKVAVADTKADEIEAQTSNGHLELTDLTFNEGSFETSNSKITLKNLNFKTGEFETTNGAIYLDRLQPKESLVLETSNAKVTGKVIGNQNDFSIDAKTSNAKNNLVKKAAGSKELTIRTSNGAIDVAIQP